MESTTRLISVEGSIGAGKSTLINLLKENFNNITFLTEPLKEYTTFKCHNPLTNLYVTPFTDCSVVQDFITKSSFEYYKKNLIDTKTEKIVVTDRSFDSVLYFIDLYVNSGYITLDSANFLKQNYFSLKPHFNKFEKLFIFLDTNPSLCKRNILKRNRISEQNISIDLLNNLQKSILKFKNNLEDNHLTIKVEEKDSKQDIFTKFCNILQWKK